MNTMIKLYRCAFIVLVGLLLSAAWCESECLETLLNEAQIGGSYVPISKEDLQKAEELFVALFQGSDKDLSVEWKALQFKVVFLTDKEESLLAIVENEEVKQGRGFFVFRGVKKSGIALQIPHSYRDLYTGNLGMKLFHDGQFIAAAWNTIPRNKGKQGIDSHVDLAQVNDSYFTAFARAFARCFEKGGLLQVHGFANKKRETEGGKGADIIVSSGTILPSQGAWYLDTCWEQRGDFAVRLYPTEVLELGGTQNATGRVFRSLHHKGFVHVELSKEVRKKLLDDTVARRKFLGCIEEVFR